MTTERARRRARRRRQHRIVASVIAAVVVGGVLVALAWGPGSEEARARTDPTSTTSATVPASSSTTTATVASPGAATPENVAFEYGAIHADTDLRRLGNVTMVVTSRQRDPRAVEAIHRIGAKAYRYVQTYWFPARPDRDGIDLTAHPDWGFCKSGSAPVIGHRAPGGEPLTYLDMNERAVRDFLRVRFAQLRQQGWDGVFLDRGFAALTGIDTEPAGIWNRTSTCTAQPVTPGATFSDSYLGVAGDVRQAGLELMFNYGVSPFDAKTPLRPNPRASQCATLPNPQCPRLDDGWTNANWILDEAVTHPRDENWAEDFAANSANEHDPAHGGHVVGLITQALMGGDESRAAIFYEWSRARLFAIPMAIGTGSGGCGNVAPGSICNRRLFVPELASTTFGPPVEPAPVAIDCDPGSTIHCTWVRRYQRGIVVVNARDHAVSVRIPVGTACRKLTDVFTGSPLAGGGCVTQVDVGLPAWSGRPLAG
ncbi:MAG: hypothetical protein ACXVJ7_13230 [Acidimicrobiia bacterium]